MRGGWMGLGALAIVLWAAVIPFPLAIDTGTFSLVAERWSEGDALYAEIADNKPPATIAAYRAALALFGREKPHVAVELAMQMLSLALVIALARRAWGEDTAFRAGVLWVVASFAYQMPDTIGESETLCLPLVLVAMWIGADAMRAGTEATLDAKRRASREWIARHALLGAIGGTLVAIKIVPLAVPLAISAWIAWRRRVDRAPFAAAAAFAGGAALALAPWLAWVALDGGLDEMIAMYAGWQSPTAAPLGWRAVMVLVLPLYLIPAGILALLAPFRLRHDFREADGVAFAALAGALAALAVQGKFFVYHVLLALPALVLLGARWWAIVRGEPGAKRIAGVVLAIIVVGGPIARRGGKWLDAARLATGALTRAEYDAKLRIDVPVGIGVATHESSSGTRVRIQQTNAGVLYDPAADASLAAAIPSGARVFLWGLAPQALFRAEARSASRFPHYLPYACMGCDPAFRAELVRELEAAPPDLVVVQRDLVNPVDIGTLARADDLLARFPELDGFVGARYALSSTHGGFALYVPR